MEVLKTSLSGAKVVIDKLNEINLFMKMDTLADRKNIKLFTNVRDVGAVRLSARTRM